METLKALTFVLRDGTTPSDGFAPLVPTVQPFVLPMGVDVTIPFIFKGANKTLRDLTGWIIIFTIRDAATGFERLARGMLPQDINPAGSGIIVVDRGDTGAGGVASSPYPATYDVIAYDPNGRTWRGVEPSALTPSPSMGDPTQPFTPPAGSVFIGGNPRFVSTAVKVANYTAAFNDLVRCDPTGGVFAVTLPAASSAVIGSADWIVVKHVSDSANAVTVTPAGADTIDGLSGPFFVAARERLMLVSNGVSDWMVL